MNRRYFIEISFKGTAYHGWQSQSNATSVQSVLSEAILKVTGKRTVTIGAGRTDAGVHARSFTAHFDSRSSVPADNKLIYSLNSVLPPDIAVKDIREVNADAHARFSAISRTYEYTICKMKDPFLNDFAWLYSRTLDVNAMNTAALRLMEYSDFTSFSKLHSNVKTNNCNVTEAYWTYDDKLLRFRISADRFLRNMVRAIVGTLVCVGNGKTSIDEFTEIIEKKDRALAKFSAPAHGLSLVTVRYPDEIFLNCI